MSRWDGWQRASKKPPPEHGIKLKKAGTTWWGQRWIGALEQVLRGDAGRLARGRTYARAGRTHDLEVKDGAVTAKVTGSRATPYKIRIELAQLSAAAWAKAIAGMAEQAQFAAELLAGQMPQQIDEVFVAAGCSLFPRERADLETSCSCPDWGDPCKHVAATHYVLGEALDRDPFLLFELRGRTKPQVLAALREARGGGDVQAARGASEVPGVSLGKLSDQDYDRPRAALPALELTFDEPASHASVLRQLGAPAAWGSDASPAEVFAPMLRAAAEQARRIALGEVEPAPAPTDTLQEALSEEPAPRGRRTRKRSAAVARKKRGAEGK